MRKLDKMYWVLASIKDHIYNAKNGIDMEDYSFGIRYKDGTTVYVIGNDLPEKRIYIDRQKITYCFESNPDDSSDSTGKTWFRDFHGEHDQNGETLEAWDEYTNKMMYGE